VQELLNSGAWFADRATDSLLRYHPPTKEGRYAAYAIDGRSRWAGLSKHVEAEVFGEAFHDSPETLEREYGPYDQVSTFLTVVDVQSRTVAGVLRVIRWSSAGSLKTLCDVWNKLGLDERTVQNAHGIDRLLNCWDVGTCACRQGYRGGHVSGLLYGLLQQQCVANGVEHVVTVLDAKVLELMRGLGIPFASICGSAPFPYMGSAKSIACHMRVADAGPSVLAKLGADNWLARQLAYGEGLPALQKVGA
jgi:N-acyl-L-homoserine lactone synthetase